jgi:hypothetical protein
MTHCNILVIKWQALTLEYQSNKRIILTITELEDLNMEKYNLVYIGNAFNMIKGKTYECTKHKTGIYTYFKTVNEIGKSVEFFPQAFQQ